MRVKIAKNPESENSWYFGMVGQVFEVKDKPEQFLSQYYYRLKQNNSMAIVVTDAEIVPDEPEPTRKIVQITSNRVENTAATQCHEAVYALCNDGSVWRLQDTPADLGWDKLPEIPQD